MLVYLLAFICLPLSNLYRILLRQSEYKHRITNELSRSEQTLIVYPYNIGFKVYSGSRYILSKNCLLSLGLDK